MDESAEGVSDLNNEEESEGTENVSHTDTNESVSEGQDSETSIEVELSYLSGSGVTVAGRDIVLNLSYDSNKRAREILSELKEVFSSRRISTPPSPDAPLQTQIDFWFLDELVTSRDKLFVVTLCIFNGLKYPDFCEIFDLVLEAFKVNDTDEEESLPAFVFEDDEPLREHYQATLIRSDDGLEEIIQFKDEHYQAAVFDLLRRRHRKLLLKLLPVLKLVVERHRYWEIRSKAAASVAEIGKISYFQVVSKVLNPWATDQRAYVRAAVGYPLARFAEDNNYRKHVGDLLDKWTNPELGNSREKWRYRWTAASAYKQIGLNETDWANEWVFSGLKKLAGYDDIRIADAVIHSMIVLSLQKHLVDVLLALKSWIEEGSAGTSEDAAPQARCIVALMSFMIMSEIHIEVEEEMESGTSTSDQIPYQVENLLEIVRRSVNEADDIWELMVSVGIRSFEYELTERFFLLITRWTELAKDDLSLQNVVRNLMAEVYVQLRPLEKELVWNQLTIWERQTEHNHLTEIATSSKIKIRDRVLSEPFPSSSSQNRIRFAD